MNLKEEIKAMLEENDRLKRENAKLREENEKLREDGKTFNAILDIANPPTPGEIAANKRAFDRDTIRLPANERALSP